MPQKYTRIGVVAYAGQDLCGLPTYRTFRFRKRWCRHPDLALPSGLALPLVSRLYSIALTSGFLFALPPTTEGKEIKPHNQLHNIVIGLNTNTLSQFVQQNLVQKCRFFLYLSRIYLQRNCEKNQLETIVKQK